jgi:hypothetical protein
MNYYYRDNQQREIGPLPLSALAQLRQAGLLTDETPVRAEMETTWNAYCQVIARETPAGPTTKAQPVSISPLPPTNDRLARAKKYSWFLFAFAALCFLLPFFEFSNSQRRHILTGQLLLAGGEAEACVALGLTMAALLLAVIRKPFAALLSAVSGIGATATLLAMKADIAVIGADHVWGQLSIREGFWLACALLTAGAVAQFALFSQARSAEGWKWHRRHGLGLAGIALAVVIFFGGPFAYDTLTNTAPPTPPLQDKILQKMPDAFSPFKVVSTDYKFDHTGEQATGNATLTLALKAPLYTTDDFQKRATEHGDDPAVYASALERSGRLPADLAPTAPSNQSPPLFSLAEPEGHQAKANVAFTASKVPRGWSLADCLRAWTHRRDWQIGQVSWPALPKEFNGLVSANAISSQGGLILGEDSTEGTLRAYVSDRRAFIAAVAQAETQRNRKALENSIADAVRAELAKKLNLTGVYSIKSLKVDLPVELPSATNPQIINAEAQVEQQIDLYRLAKEQPAQWPEFQADSDFAKKKAFAEKISSKLSPPVPAQPVVYELTSPAHSVTIVDFKIQTTGLSNAPVVQSVVWPENTTTTEQSLVNAQDAGTNALFATQPAGDQKLPAVQDYRNQIQTFTKAIAQAWEELIAQRHALYFVSQQRNDSHFDKFSFQDDSFFEVYHRYFANRYEDVWNAIPQAFKDTTNEVLTSDEAFGAISGKFEFYSRGFFDPSGVWRPRILVTETENGVLVEVKTYIYIAWNAPGQANSREEIEKIYSGHMMLNPQFDGYGNKYLTEPQFRNFGIGLWTMHPDANESKKQSQLFLDKLSAELSGTPPAAK